MSVKKLKDEVDSRLKKINDVTYDPDLFITHKTDTPMDRMFSIDGGIPKATNWMIVGDPGVGKCVTGETLIQIKVNSTGEILTLPIKQLHEMIKKSK